MGQQQQQQQQQQNPVQEAGPAAVEGEEQGNNDILDYAYAIIRIVILFCIMYVHSSLFRLLFVAGMIMVVYMIQGRNNNNRENNNNNPAGQANNNNNDANNNREQEEGEEQPEVDEAVELVNREPKPHILVVAATFVTTLF